MYAEMRLLHPVFGPGEDRNGGRGDGFRGTSGLHPVFGPGEDRNALCAVLTITSACCCTRSSDRVRIATGATSTCWQEGWTSCTRSSDRVRIATRVMAAPETRPPRCTRSSDRVRIATGGSAMCRRRAACCTRSSDRVRIATPPGASAAGQRACCTRSSDRVRIATARRRRAAGRRDGLHPVFGPGEDRNGESWERVARLALAAPGLRTG